MKSEVISDKMLRGTFIAFVITAAIFSVQGLFTSRLAVGNQDNYKDLFSAFLAHGYYDSVATGTSILYNCALWTAFQATHSIDASFVWVNGLSELILLLFGSWFCYVVAGRGRYFPMIVAVYIFGVLNMRSYLRASNDTFLAVFVVFLLYCLVHRIYNRKREMWTFALAGQLLGCCLSIRITAVLLLPLILIAFLFWARNDQKSVLKRARLMSVFTIAAAAVVFALHYPSIENRGKLSYENKDPGTGVTWMQRNYLGLKKIEQGREKIHRDAIWKHTGFPEVAEYVKLHGTASVPNSLLQVAVKDPVLLAKITIYNVLSCTGRLLRFWGILFLIPLIALMRRRHDSSKVPATMYVLYTCCICLVSFSFVEARWFYGYDVLLPVSIALAAENYPRDRRRVIDFMVAASLISITIINLRTIILKF